MTSQSIIKKKPESVLERSEIEYQIWLEELEKTPDNEVDEYIRETLRDKKLLHIFGRYHFPHIIKGTDPVPDAHLDLIAELSSPQNRAIIFPRGFAKSTWMKIDTLHDIVYDLEPVILYISGTLRDAQFHFESMKYELEGNLSLIDIYGDLVPNTSRDGSKWTNTHFETTNGVNCVARGAGKGRGVNIKGQRPTKIIGDDIEEDEQVRSADRREKLHHWLYNVIFPSTDLMRGKIKLVGTILHQSAEILAFYKKHGGIFRKAIENGESIWPKYWTMEKLDERKEEIGTRAFSQEYMNTPTSDDMANINPLWIDDNTFTVLPPAKSLLRLVLHLDPQAGETNQSDEFALTVLGFYKGDPHRWSLEQQAGRESQMDQAIRVINAWHAWKKKGIVHVVQIEKVLNQTAVYQIIKEWASGKIDLEVNPEIDKRDIPVKGVSPKDTKSKYGADKLARLQMHEPAFERGEVHLHISQRHLRDQILFLGQKILEHDDRADSFVSALEASYNYSLGDTTKIEYTADNNKTIVGNIHDAKF